MSNKRAVCSYTLPLALGPLPPYSDKAVLPPSVLEDVLSSFQEHELPHPLIFRVATEKLNYAYIGVKEFTSAEAAVVPQHILNKLQAAEGDEVNIELVDDVPKGTFLKLKPLQFYQNVNNWKFFLESKLTNYYTSLTRGETLTIQEGSSTYELAIEDINAKTISIIDTDIILDVVPLNDIMAQQTLDYHISEKQQEIAVGADIAIDNLQPFNANPNMTIYKLDLLKVKSAESLYIEIEATQRIDSHMTESFNIDVIIGFDSLLSLENFTHTSIDQDFEVQKRSSSTKVVAVPIKGNDEITSRINKCIYDLQDGYGEDEVAKWLYIVPFTWEITSSIRLRVGTTPPAVHVAESESGSPCKNCHKIISDDKMALHEAYCFKNNVTCSCGNTYLKAIPPNHWHCPECSQYSDSSLYRFKHQKLFHDIYKCDDCGVQYDDYVTFTTVHKARECGKKMHECRFCKLVLEQGQATVEDRFEQVSHHENLCGNKTDECPQCQALVRRKDLRKHLKIHSLDNKAKAATMIVGFNKCANANCINIVQHNEMNLCEFCYGPLYSTLYDPTHAKLQARLERRYVIQLTKGCGQTLCANIHCKRNLSQPMGIKDAVKTARQLMAHISAPALPLNEGQPPGPNEAWFCVGDKMTQKKVLFDVFKQTHQPELVANGLAQIDPPDEAALTRWLQSCA